MRMEISGYKSMKGLKNSWRRSGSTKSLRAWARAEGAFGRIAMSHENASKTAVRKPRAAKAPAKK
jgi:hypothetical protein